MTKPFAQLTEEQRERQREHIRNHRAKKRQTPEGRKALNKHQKRNNLRKIGWTLELSAACRLVQHERCAICPRELGAEFCHDHAHQEPPVARGLLCRACNLSLGYYEKWQRPAGLVLEPYERYLSAPPVRGA